MSKAYRENGRFREKIKFLVCFLQNTSQSEIVVGSGI